MGYILYIFFLLFLVVILAMTFYCFYYSNLRILCYVLYIVYVVLILITYSKTTIFDKDGLYFSTERKNELVQEVEVITGSSKVMLLNTNILRKGTVLVQVDRHMYNVFYETNKSDLKVTTITKDRKFYYDSESNLDWLDEEF